MSSKVSIDSWVQRSHDMAKNVRGESAEGESCDDATCRTNCNFSGVPSSPDHRITPITGISEVRFKLHASLSTVYECADPSVFEKDHV